MTAACVLPGPITPVPDGAVDRWTDERGGCNTIRPVRGDDARHVASAALRVSPETIYNRFMAAIREISPEEVARAVNPDPRREHVVIALRQDDAGFEAIGGGRFWVRPDAQTCEFALIVVDAWQGRHLGKRIIRALALEARHRGMRRIDGEMLSTNTRMHELARQLGFRIERSPAGATMDLISLALVGDPPLWIALN